jgi:hypothetical protein
MIYGDEYLDGLALCLENYRHLQKLNPKHELLKFGDVNQGDSDCNFYFDEDNRGEFNKRFAKDGINPRGHYACAYALARYSLALMKATEEVEGRCFEEGKLAEKARSFDEDSPDIFF